VETVQIPRHVHEHNEAVKATLAKQDALAEVVDKIAADLKEAKAEFREVLEEGRKLRQRGPDHLPLFDEPEAPGPEPEAEAPEPAEAVIDAPPADAEPPEWHGHNIIRVCRGKTVDAMLEAGVIILGDLADLLMTHGIAWYKHVPGIGAKIAEQIEARFVQVCPEKVPPAIEHPDDGCEPSVVRLLRDVESDDDDGNAFTIPAGALVAVAVDGEGEIFVRDDNRRQPPNVNKGSGASMLVEGDYEIIECRTPDEPENHGGV